MNHGVELLLQRMDSHPEEFNTHGPDKRVKSKWSWVTGSLKGRIDYMRKFPHVEPVQDFESLAFLSDREIIMLYEKFQSIQAESFSRRVMSTLLTDGDN